MHSDQNISKSPSERPQRCLIASSLPNSIRSFSKNLAFLVTRTIPPVLSRNEFSDVAVLFNLASGTQLV